MRILGNTASSYLTELYSFSFTVFAPGGATGPNGPNITQARSVKGGSEWASLYLNMTTNGIQEWTVPQTATYRFLVAGAQGGNGATISTPGNGAVLQGDVSLTMGQVLNIVVGQLGTSAGSGTSRGGGGGGASFVYSGEIGGNGLMFAAAGGGGCDDLGGIGASARSDLLPSLDGAGTVQTHNGLGGTGAQGGNGAGWLGVPTVGTNNGSRFIGGGGIPGGFGAAGGDVDDGGGGGGFTGGGSTASSGGGAGGSYYPGFSTAAAFASIWQPLFSNYSWAGNNPSFGSVAVTKL
jgi:hypothetical protein